MTGAQSLVIAGSALVGMGALVAGVWRARWQAARTVVARAPMLARPPVTEQTVEFAPVVGFPPWEVDGGLMYSTAGIMGCDSGAMAAVGGGQWPGPADEPPDPGEPPTAPDLQEAPLNELPAWTDAELAALHDAPTVFDVDWVESWLSDGWADRMAAEIKSWR